MKALVKTKYFITRKGVDLELGYVEKVKSHINVCHLDVYIPFNKNITTSLCLYLISTIMIM